jgi:DNA-binding winged helix-turn-helix (wHTH) protein
MNDWKKALEAYINTCILGTAVFICLIVIVVNSRYIVKLETTLNTVWHEIEQVKETNISLYQFIEKHKNDFD